MAEMFEFLTGGVGVMPDPDDNAAGHTIPNHESGTRISFELRNVGDASGLATVGIELDDTFKTDFQSSVLNPGQQEAGFVVLGRLDAGSHSVLVVVNPGSGQADHQTNTFDVE